MTTEVPIPGQYDHCGRFCPHCEALGPFRRPAKSSDPWRCVTCGQPERYIGADNEPDNEPPQENLVVKTLKERESAAAERPATADNGNGEGKPEVRPGLVDAAVAEVERPTPLTPISCYECGADLGHGLPQRLYRCEDGDACRERVAADDKLERIRNAVIAAGSQAGHPGGDLRRVELPSEAWDAVLAAMEE